MHAHAVAATAAQLSRFAVAEVHPPAERGRAVSSVVLGGTVGAVAGPLFVGPSGQLALSNGLSELAGPFLVGLFTFAAASLLPVLRLHPDPRDLGREVAALQVERGAVEAKARPVREIVREPGIIVAVSSMVFAQAVMVMLMTITALHMREHEHALSSISVAISSHTFGMYAFSIVSGRLADRWGRGIVILIGAITLLAACLAAPLSPQVLPLSISLFPLALSAWWLASRRRIAPAA